jgi:hypothetical protein
MPLPEVIRVKLSTEAAGAISVTAVVARDMPLRELVEEMLPLLGKDEARIREALGRGTLVSGGSRFRWTAIEAASEEVRTLLGTFPDSNPDRVFEASRCVAVVLHGQRRRIEIPREIAAAKRFLRSESYWDALIEAARAGEVRYREYSYRRRADQYDVRFSPPDAERLRNAARLMRYSTLRDEIARDAISSADLFVER